MASHYHQHHHNNHQTTTTSCCCQTPLYHPSPPPPPPPPFPPSLSSDPFLLAAIIAEILQTQHRNPIPQNPLNFYSHPIKPTTINPHQRCSHPETHQFAPHSVFSSFSERIDAIEASLHRFSSLYSRPRFSLRDAAARTIQTHFRAYLVRRSRTLGQLKELASIKSCLSSLKSSVSRRGFVDFDSLSREAMDLKLQLSTVKGDDQMIRDSKASIAEEIVQFLEMVYGFRGKKHQFTARKIRNTKLVRSDYGIARDGRRLSERGAVSRCRSMDGEEKKLIANLREKVERISRMSRALEDEEVNDEEIEGYEHIGDENGAIIDQITNNSRLKMGLPIERNAHISNAKKHGCFVEDRSVVWVTNEDGGTPLERQDEAKAQSDGQSLQSNGSCDNEDGEFTFSVPELVKIGPTAGLMMRQTGVKIVG